ncbi:MAG TPA: caspase family protein [Ohtaekwangia sp.]|uniref:caspase family protein n=1 Tax=Ohtaekwangia sp. TaxID=2066019 RepID=UPI002F92F146
MRSIPTLLFVLIVTVSFSQSLETIVQKGHELAVVSVAVSPDSNYVATGSKDKSAKLWEVSTGREVRSFLGHEATVTSLQFTSDGKLLLTGSNDKTIRMWDVVTGKELYTVTTIDYITDIAVDPKMRFFIHAGYNDSGYGDTAVVYDFKTRKPIAKCPVDPDKGLGSGVDISVSADGRWVAFGHDNRKASLYETSTWKLVKDLMIEEGFCGGCGTRVEFSTDSKSLYAIPHNSVGRKYTLSSLTVTHEYPKGEEDLKGIAISDDGKKLARATEKDITVWNEANGQAIATLQAEEGAFHEITFSHDNKHLFITCDNNTAFSWNIETQKIERTLTGFLNTRDKGGLNYDPNFYWESNIARYVRFKNSLLVSRDGKTLIKGKFGTKVKRWDIATGKTIMEYVGHKKGVLCYDLSKDGRKLLTGGGDGKIMLWDLQTGDSLQVIQSYREPIFDIHFNSDETTAVSCSWDASMKIHDLATGKMLTYFDFGSYSVYNVLFHPTDLYVITARLDHSLQLWELDTRKEVRNFIGHTDVISSIRLSSDQKTLMSASWDGSIRLWDMSTGLMTKKLKGHRGAVHMAIFHPDGKQIYSAGADRIIRVWDIGTSQVVKTFEGHNAEITTLLFSPDNRMLISHSLDGVTKFWDLATGKEFFEHIHIGEKDWMVKNPEGYFNGTDDARKFIHFVNGVKTYSVDQFFQEFYRPDLLPKIFQNRGGEEKKGIQGKLNSSPPPTVRVAVLPAVQGKAELYIKITDNGAGAENLRLLHNGKSIALNHQDLKFPSSKGQSTTYKQVIDLIGGTNTFSVVASNKDRIESDQHTTEIFSEHPSKSSTCYILAVGINEYKNSKLNLNYAKPDAESFSKIVDEKSANLFKNIELHTLYDNDATRQQILKTMDELSSKISQEDVFIFYYAGHGSMVDDKFYFIPTDNLRLYDQSSLHKDAIEASVLQEKLKQIKALKQLIVMDACQSGGSVELLATRGAGEEKAIAQLSRSAGIHVMASAGSEQFATEFAELGHGLFTYVLIKALQGAADGAPKDGKVTIYELKSYIDDQVPEMTRQLKGKPQYPYTFSRGQDFPVVIEE